MKLKRFSIALALVLLLVAGQAQAFPPCAPTSKASNATVAAGTSTTTVVTPAGLAAVYGHQVIYIPASAMTACTTNGATLGQYEYGTNDIDVKYYAFDGGATEERVQFAFPMPENWDRGTMKVKGFWTSAAGSTAGDTVQLGVKLGALSDNDAIDAALGTPQVITDTLLANGVADLHVTSATPAITVGGTPALGDLIVGEAYRDTDGTDDMAEDLHLLGVWIQYTVGNSVTAW